MKLKTEFDFDSAHRLVGHKGLCSNLHGHMWKVIVEIENNGKGLDDVGMLLDFGEMKIIKQQFDHKTILKNCNENFVLIQIIKATCGENSVYLMKENPTAENLAKEILAMLKEYGLNFKVTVFESPKSSAEVEG